MRIKEVIIGCLFSFFWFSVIGQNWYRIYEDSINTSIYDVHETYDKGYLFTGYRDNSNGWVVYGWVLKTDINGYPRWTKSYGSPGRMNQIYSSRITRQQGLISISGTNNLSDDCNDVMIFKTDACGEKEWCKIYDAPGCNSWGIDIELTEDNGYMALIYGWMDSENKRIWLFHLNNDGEVLWSQAYATGSEYYAESPWSLTKTPDSCFLITGEAYYPDPTYPSLWILKIIYVKVNSEGDVIFETPWGTNNGINNDGRITVPDLKNNCFSAGRHARYVPPYGDSPALFKLTNSGTPSFYKDLKTTSTLGIATTINWFQDSTLAMVAQWHSPPSNIDTTAIIKVDSIGNYLKQKVLTPLSGFSIWGSEITFNNRLVLAGTIYSTGLYRGCAYKFNSDLEYDSIYNGNYTYDSLCPNPIISDTISLNDCQIVLVGIEEALRSPQSTRLKIYPVPALNHLTIEMPKYIMRTSKNELVSVTTVYEQWEETTIGIYDLYGKRWKFFDKIKKNDLLQIDVSNWTPGIYTARWCYKDEVLSCDKFIISK